jgi:hypothetical protein
VHLQIALKLAAEERAQAAHRVKLEKEVARQTAILVRLAEKLGLHTDDWCAPISLSLSLSLSLQSVHAMRSQRAAWSQLSRCVCDTS